MFKNQLIRLRTLREEAFGKNSHFSSREQLPPLALQRAA